MTMNKGLLLGLGAMILAGCDSGATDAGDDALEERWGRSCYYARDNNRSATYTSASNDTPSTAKTDGGFTLTMQADAMANDPQQVAQIFTQMRREAGIVAKHHLDQSCWEDDTIAQSCTQTCAQHGLQWNQEAVVCENCVVRQDGSLDCDDPSPVLLDALQQPWHGQQPWFFADRQNQLQLVMFPPQLQQDANGELVWIADVQVTGLCLCACTGG